MLSRAASSAPTELVVRSKDADVLLPVSQDNHNFLCRWGYFSVPGRMIDVPCCDSLSTQSTSEPEVVKGTCDKIVSGSMMPVYEQGGRGDEVNAGGQNAIGLARTRVF